MRLDKPILRLMDRRHVRKNLMLERYKSEQAPKDLLSKTSRMISGLHLQMLAQQLAPAGSQ